MVQATKEGLTLIALDSSAILLASQVNVPFTILDDWISNQDDLEARTLSSELEEKWYLYAKELFTLDDICWPEIDVEAMFWFWKRVLFTKVLSRSFHSHGIKEVYIFNTTPSPPHSLFYYPSNIHAIELIHEWGKDCKIFPSRKDHQAVKYYDGFAGKLRYVKQKTENYLNLTFCKASKQKSKLLNENLKNKILIIVNPNELFRIHKHVLKLIEKFESRTCIILLGARDKLEKEIRDKYSIPVFNHNGTSLKLSNIRNKLSRAYKKNVAGCQDSSLIDIFDAHSVHFQYFIKERWPDLHAEYLFWKKLFLKSRPSLVLTTSIPDAESQIPALTTSKLGILSICLPHSIGVYRKIKLHSEIVLANFKLDQTGHILSGRSSNKISMCRDLGVTNEYPIKKEEQNLKAKNKTNVLILMGETGHTGDIFPCRNRIYQINGIKDLSSLKKEFSSVLKLKIKLHPWINDKDLIKAFEPELLKDVLPSNSDLEDALNSADFVIAVNYQGVAILHSYFHEKPVFLYWCNETASYSSPYEFAHLLMNGGTVIDSFENLKTSIKLAIENEKYRANLIAKSKNYKEQYLNDNKALPFSTIIERIISKNKQVPTII